MAVRLHPAAVQGIARALRLRLLERDLDVLSHAFGVFLQVWLAHTPPIDDGMKRTAEQSARERYSRFLDHLSAEAMRGESFVRQVAGGARRTEDGGSGDEGP